MATPIPLANHPAVRTLVDQRSLADRHAALNELAQLYSGKVLAADPSICKVFAALGDEQSASDRLANIVFLVEFRSRVREFKKLAEAPLKRLLLTEPAPLESISDEKLRVRVVMYLAQKRFNWLGDYLAREATGTWSGAKTRNSIVVGVFRNSASWSHAMDTLVNAFRLALTAPDISDAKAMRIAHGLISGSRAAIEKGSLEPGPSFGKSMAAFLDVLRNGQFRGERDTATRTLLAADVVAIGNAVTASHPALLIDRALFEAIANARVLTAKSRESAQVLKHIVPLMGRLKGAIKLAVRFGIADGDLFSHLEWLAGSREAALKVTRAISRERPGLAANMQAWLNEGVFSDPRSEAMSSSDDHAIAVLLLRAAEYQAQGRDGSRGDALVVEALAVGRKRRLEVVGAPGDIVDYDPVQHRLADAASSTASKVKVLVSSVIKRLEDGETAIVVPAIVEPVSHE